jgi:hypothetical protein
VLDLVSLDCKGAICDQEVDPRVAAGALPSEERLVAAERGIDQTQLLEHLGRK